MRIRLSDPSLVPELLEFLSAREDCALASVATDAVEVSLLGSYGAEAAHEVVEQRLREWRAAHPSAPATLEDEAGPDASLKSLSRS